MSVVSYLLSKLLDSDHKNFRPIYLFQDIVMSVVRDNVFCIGCNGTVDKLIVIKILLNEPKMVIGILK